MTLSTLFEAYLRARYDIVLTNFSNGVLNRFLTSISVILLSFSIITFEKLLLFQAPIYLLGLLLILFYSYKKENFSILFRLNKIKKHVNEITNYSIFSILNSFGNILVMNVDILMVTALLGLSETGIYATAFYIGLMIAIPRRAIAQISIPIISENIKENNFNKIEKNYKLVSLHLLLIGIFIYLLIIINLNDIFYLIPNSQNFISGKNVVYIIGLAKLVTMAFSFNGELIMMSKYFKFNVITILILATLSIILNYLLIPNFGMIGAAYASLISILIFNLIKLIFIKIKMKILPFSNKTIMVIFMGLLTYFLSIYIPNLENSLINILLKSTLISIFYIILIYKSKISPEFNTILNRIISPQKS
jgi:O-antigen/teichoic acid export membrane protein